jgi:protein O-GlcNAc transferase
VQSYNKALELAPNIALARAENLHIQGKCKEAIEWYDKFLNIKPNDIAGLLNEGVALVNMQKFKEAIELYNKALEIAPNCTEAWYYKGSALDKIDGANKLGKLFKVGGNKEAKECFDIATA